MMIVVVGYNTCSGSSGNGSSDSSGGNYGSSDSSGGSYGGSSSSSSSSSYLSLQKNMTKTMKLITKHTHKP